ncbi:TonB-dependent receptor [Pseudomonas silvicola]|nr:TonB-dependent receptor [Pseudomonas silvicola]
MSQTARVLFRPLPAAGLLLAASAFSVPIKAEDALDTVVVTGVRGTQQRTLTDSPVPIDVYTSEQLTATGKSGLKEILARLIPSMNVPTFNGGGTGFLVRGISMRGLGGDQVLILVNGKRRHNTAMINNNARVGNASAPVDLDLIPTAAVERIEVLRDGAAAQYGSDAIAGVINIILKRDAQGASSDTSLGQYYDGDGTTGHQAANVGSPLGDGGFFNLSLDGKVQEPYIRDAGATGQLYFNQADGTPDPRESNRHGWGNEYGLGRDRTASTAYNLELPLQDALKLYSFSTLSYRNSNKDLGHRKPTDITSLAGVEGAPYGNGGQARREIEEVDYQATAGLKGLVSGWDWDLSSSYGRDRAQLYTDNNLNISNGPDFSQHRFHLGNEIFDQWTNNLDFTRALDIGWSSPLQTSVGVEYRWEQFTLEEGEPNSYNQGSYVIPTGPFAGRVPDPGLFSVAGTSPEDAGRADRHSTAGYLDLGLNLTPNWYVGTAVRHESYNQGIGETTSGKFTTRYEFLPGYAVRAAVSKGFRAPSLAQEEFSTTSSITQFGAGGATSVVRTKQMRPDSAEAIALGAKALKPETSMSYSLGLTAEPMPRLRMTADWYLIDIDDRILQTGVLSGSAVSSILVANGLPANLAGQYYANAADTRTQGVDLVAEYTQPLEAYGEAKFSLAYNHNKNSIRSLADNPSQLSSLGAGYVLFDRQQQMDLTRATPKDKWIANTRYRVAAWNVNLTLTRYGQYTEGSNLPENDRTYSAKWITDLDVAYDLTDHVTVALGANNLFDVYPDKKGIRTWAGTYEYGMFSPYGFGGGFYYGRVSVAF